MSTFPPIERLHHFAWRCKDAEVTRQFYEDLLGLPLVHLIRADVVPSTGEYCPYVHLFFQLQDGSCIAFFDLGDDEMAEPSPNTPAWVNHLALRVPSREALAESLARLRGAGVDVIGVTDHGFVNSIYFFDPNGIRLELTVDVGSESEAAVERANARSRLDAWVQEKQARRVASAVKA